MKNERLPSEASAAAGAGAPAVAPAATGLCARTCSRSSAIWSMSTAVPMAAKERCLSSWVSFSEPTARATSTAPDPTAMQARWNAVDADAQAFSTLTMGMPSRPVWRSATCPRIISWPWRMPAVAFEKKAICTASGPIPASRSASPTASSARERIVQSGNFPKRVIAAPAIRTSATASPPRVSVHRRSTVWPASWRSQVAGVMPRWRRIPYWTRWVSVFGSDSTNST